MVQASRWFLHAITNRVWRLYVHLREFGRHHLYPGEDRKAGLQDSFVERAGSTGKQAGRNWRQHQHGRFTSRRRWAYLFSVRDRIRVCAEGRA